MAETRARWLCSIAFALALTQDSLYTANQNTKMLHGAASAGHGSLSRDWMANTVDPLPVFTALVDIMFRFGLPQLSYVIYALLAAGCAWSLTSVVHAAGLLRRQRPHLVIFLTGLILTQAVFNDWPDGLADQYMMGHYLQPCVFGVLLIAGIAQFLRGRTIVAIVSCVAAAYVHPDYLPSATVCIGIFIVTPSSDMPLDRRRALVHALIAAGLLLPLLLLLRSVVAPTSIELRRQSLDVLVGTRIPQHAEVSRWFDSSSVVRLAVMAAGAHLARSRALRTVMWSLFALIIGTMLLTSVFQLEALEAVTPWRASVLLMPLALATIVARAADRLCGRYGHREALLVAAGWTLVTLSVVYGVWRQHARIREYATVAPMAAISWIALHSQPSDLYLVPVRDSDFDRFRLETGLPILINWKTHPYKDVELLEWQSRVVAADAFYDAAAGVQACEVLAGLARRYGITAAVIPATHPLAAQRCEYLRDPALVGGYLIGRVALPTQAVDGH